MKRANAIVRHSFFAVIPACTLSLSALCASTPSVSQSSWEKSRMISDFQNLLKHSPFSLPTAEEGSPLAERYAMTGIISIGGEQEVFVFDRTDQSRELISRTPNAKNMALVSILRDGNAPPTKATIRVGNETGIISYLESVPQQSVAGQQSPPGSPASVSQGPGRPGVQLPNLPVLPRQPIMGPGAPGQPPNQLPPARRIIRRPIISPQQAQPTTP